MMRALRILDSPYAPTLGILRDFRIICCMFLVFDAMSKWTLMSRRSAMYPLTARRGRFAIGGGALESVIVRR